MDSIKKNAYLIIAHNEFAMLKLLIMSLDDTRSDIYVAMDAKSKTFDQSEFADITKHSKLFFVKRAKNYWCTFTHAEITFNLMREAARVGYEYYHVISGIDVPLKTQDEMCAFLEQNKGKEFIAVDRDISWDKPLGDFWSKEKFYEKVILYPNTQWTMYYNYFKKYRGIAKTSYFGKVMCILFRLSIVFQKLLRITNSSNKGIKVYHGSDWFSVTNDFVNEAIDKYDWFRQHFEYSFCPSEFFAQTIVMNSELRLNVYKFDSNKGLSTERSNVRHLDFERGNHGPYIFRVDDYDELVNSDCLFARKFSTSVDKEIIRKLYYRLLPADVVDGVL